MESRNGVVLEHVTQAASVWTGEWKLNFDSTTNVVDVYINYFRGKVDSGYDRALIRTIRGVGYQISVEPSGVRAHLTAVG